jgi:hypothetical protein
MADEEQPPQLPAPATRRPPPEPVVAALRDPAVVRLYANGFTIGLSNADTHIVLQLFGRPVAVWNLSYTLAKTLAQKLTHLVETWEKQTGHEVVTTDKVDLAFKDAGERQ